LSKSFKGADAMSDNAHKKCYGKMFPSVLPPEAGRVVSGKVFTYELVRAGAMLVSQRKAAANMAEWDDCLQCPEFDPCHKLSAGRLALETAVTG
jgi:hypothetical protein